MSIVRIFWLAGAIAATVIGAYAGYVLAVLPIVMRDVGRIIVPILALPVAAVIAPFDPDAAAAVTTPPDPVPFSLLDWTYIVAGPAFMALGVGLVWLGFFRRRWRTSLIGVVLGVVTPFVALGAPGLFA